MTVAELRSKLLNVWVDENCHTGFPRYVEQKYGIKLYFEGVISGKSSIADFTIVDEQKYTVFLLRYL